MCSMGLNILCFNLLMLLILISVGGMNVLCVYVLGIGNCVIVWFLFFIVVMCVLIVCFVLVLIIGLMLVDSWFGLLSVSLCIVFFNIVSVWFVMLFCRYRMCSVEYC